MKAAKSNVTLVRSANGYVWHASVNGDAVCGWGDVLSYAKKSPAPAEYRDADFGEWEYGGIPRFNRRAVCRLCWDGYITQSGSHYVSLDERVLDSAL